MAKTRREKAVAFGFVTHNNVNGADFTAHNSEDGYVIAKAKILNPLIKSLLVQNGIPISDELDDELMEVSHTLVEYAADLLIRKKYDRFIGTKMIASAIARDDGFPKLLAKAYTDGFAGAFGLSEKKAIFAIIKEEAKFRRLTINYGTILRNGDRKAQDEVAKYLAKIAPDFLNPYGIEILPEELLPIIQIGIVQALDLCKDDLLPAVETTIKLIKDNLADCRDGEC